MSEELSSGIQMELVKNLIQFPYCSCGILSPILIRKYTMGQLSTSDFKKFLTTAHNFDQRQYGYRAREVSYVPGAQGFASIIVPPALRDKNSKASSFVVAWAGTYRTH